MEVIIKPHYSDEYKQKAWLQIKQACPESAGAIKKIIGVFGKPEMMIFKTK